MLAITECCYNYDYGVREANHIATDWCTRWSSLLELLTKAKIKEPRYMEPHFRKCSQWMFVDCTLVCDIPVYHLFQSLYCSISSIGYNGHLHRLHYLDNSWLVKHPVGFPRRKERSYLPRPWCYQAVWTTQVFFQPIKCLRRRRGRRIIVTNERNIRFKVYYERPHVFVVYGNIGLAGLKLGRREGKSSVDWRPTIINWMNNYTIT